MNDLLSAVLADPQSDARCVLSDQFAEGNVTIPTLNLPAGVEVVLRDGLPDEIRCTMREWCGQLTCRDCDGKGDYLHPTYYRQPCKPCNGTGRTPGVAKAVCEAWPVTQVVLTDKRPNDGGIARQQWFRESHRVAMPHQRICDPLFLTISELYSGNLYSNQFGQHMSFKTPVKAIAALSHAALTYGRRLAGLPELKQG